MRLNFCSGHSETHPNLMVGRDGGQKFRGQPEGKALKQQGCLKSFRELFAGLGSHLLCPTVGESLLLGERIF